LTVYEKEGVYREEKEGREGEREGGRRNEL